MGMRRKTTWFLTLATILCTAIGSAVGQEPTPTEDDQVTIIVPKLAGTAESPTSTPGEIQPTATATLRAPIREIVQFEPYQIPTDVNPLTGLRTDPAILDRRPLVIKVSNAPASVRPQAGLGSADVVIEHIVESGLTRLSAVFYGETPERVGSVRSARLIDTDIVRMYDALLAYSGGSQGVRDDIYWYIPYRRIFLDGATTEFVRDWDVAAPHNLYALPAEIWEGAERLGERARPEDIHGNAFRTLPPAGAQESASHVEVKHVSLIAEWFYDAELRQYLRFTDGEMHLDALSGQPLAVENVLVVYAYHELTDIVEDVWNEQVSYGHRISLLQSGDLLLFRDGQVYRGRWSRPSASEQLRFYDQENLPLYLKPGSSWIHIVRLPQQMRSDAEWVRWDDEGLQ